MHILSLSYILLHFVLFNLTELKKNIKPSCQNPPVKKNHSKGLQILETISNGVLTDLKLK